MVEDLIAGETAFTGDLSGCFKVGHIEVAYAPGENLPLALKLLEARDRVLQRVLAAPVQEVGIQPIGFEPGERLLARSYCPVWRGMIWKDLGDQENFIASP